MFISNVGGFVWQDLNHNGIQDEDEPGISDVQVNLYEVNETLIQIVETDAYGYYKFTKLCNGNYTIDVDETTLPSGFIPTVSKVGDDNLIDSDGPLDQGPVFVTFSGDKHHDLTVDFGYILCNGTIGDYVWLDLNCNGLQDGDEPGIAGVRVMLIESMTGLILAETVTNEFGSYFFDSLCPGNYIVSVDFMTFPPDYMLTIPKAGSDDSIDSDGLLDIENNTISAPVVLLDENMHNHTIDEHAQ